MLRTKEVARILDCSPEEVLWLVRKGALKAEKNGQQYRYRPEDVTAFQEKATPSLLSSIDHAMKTGVNAIGTTAIAEQEEFLRSKDVAHILDCTPEHVVQLAKKGKLKAKKSGKFWKYSLRDVMAFREKHEVQAA